MIEVRTPSRLHFGLLSYGNDAQTRQFGGVGLMVKRPDVKICIEPSATYSGTGRLSDRAVGFARRFAQGAVASGLVTEVPPVAIRVQRVPRPHTGLGTGTQLGMAVGRALASLLERDDLTVAELAGLVGRGQRSAVGAHGCFGGGFIVEGGKADAESLSPKVIQHPFPQQWRVVLVRPAQLHGITGEREQQAFERMPPLPGEMTDRMCRLVLLGLAPAVVETDLDRFGNALYELQRLAGQSFKSAQGGVYAHPLLDQMVTFIRDQGFHGIGQSSWGPTLYAISGDQDESEWLAARVQRKFGLEAGEVLITEPDNRGAKVCRVGSPVSIACR